MTSKDNFQRRHRGKQALSRFFVHEDSLPKNENIIEDCRAAYELKHGPTDITKYYTSMRPLEDQLWLVDNHPRVWFDGLPPFLQEAMRQSLQEHAMNGRLDDVPEGLIRLWFDRQFRGGNGRAD